VVWGTGTVDKADHVVWGTKAVPLLE
jgi:hypothetical protein